MIFIHRTETNPLFNIAAEEYVLKHIDEDVLMLWQSEPSVVVGKHQNLMAEVNLAYTRAKQIPVIRRISGGGTVYHDLGNLNYTFIRKEENRERLINFKAFSMPVIEFLKTLGIESDFEGKNNLVVHGKKFSGNAAHVFKNRVMHHGTLLFNTNLDELEKVIRPAQAYITDKSVKSVRAAVANLKESLKNSMSMEGFREQFTGFLLNFYNVNKTYSFSGEDKKVINTLIDNKYNTNNWNYGYSPAYEFENRGSNATLFIAVKKGIIEQISIEGLPLKTEMLLGKKHTYQALVPVIEMLTQDEDKREMLIQLFGF